MDIFDYAMQLEKDGEEFYRKLSKSAKNKGIKNIFNMLADDESKHYQVFQAMKTEENTKMTETQILDRVKNYFQEIGQNSAFIDDNASQIEAYKKAQELEKKTEDFYLRKAQEAENHKQKESFIKIAGEEKKHYILLENLISFVSRPQEWLENAEFNHLDEY